MSAAMKTARKLASTVALDLEITPALPALGGTLMELEDCAFPLLSGVKATDKAEEAFEGAD